MSRRLPHAGRFVLPVVAVLCVMLAVASVPRRAEAQVSPETPSREYMLAFLDLNEGDHAEALKAFKSAGVGGIKGANGRWIDSICYYTMIGECYYRMGQYQDALEHYRTAMQLHLAFPDWMIRVDWPQAVAPLGQRNGLRINWAAPQRNIVVGRFPETMTMTVGNITRIGNNGPALANLRKIPINVVEITRCLMLAIRRAGEILGPTASFDQTLSKLNEEFQRRQVPPNHWSNAWMDMLQGLTFAATGNGNAVGLLKRGMLVLGRFDHPFTSVALFELGRLELSAANFEGAESYFREATLAAAMTRQIPTSIVMEEAFRYAMIAHLLSAKGGKQLYPPIAGGEAQSYARREKLRYLEVSLLLSHAENLAVLKNTRDAVQTLTTARALASRPGADMLSYTIGSRYQRLLGLTFYQQGRVADGDKALATTLTWKQAGHSKWLLQTALANQLAIGGSITARQGLDLYATVLRDPTRADWLINPLDSLTVQTTPRLGPMENWFYLAWSLHENSPEKPFEISELIRRHRFHAALQFGGRLLSLRWMLDGPEELLDPQTTLERRDILLKYPVYAQLNQQLRATQTALRQMPPVPAADDARKRQEELLLQVAAISQKQELLLREMTVSRQPAPLLFPPVRTFKEVQQGLPEGSTMLAYFATSKDLFAFMLDKDNYAGWTVGSTAVPVKLRKNLENMLRGMGNFENNREVPVEELADLERWRKPAAGVMEGLFAGTKSRLPKETTELIVVPEGPLWYLPFEALPVESDSGEVPLIAKMRVRYAPTGSLGVPDVRGRKPVGNTGVLLGRLFPGQDDLAVRSAYQELNRVVQGCVALPEDLPGPTSLYAGLFDRLIVLDDIRAPERTPLDWMPVDSDPPALNTVESWLGLPWGAPDQVVLPGFHSPAENSLKSPRKGDIPPTGQDLFLSTMGLMASGSRTILISRWRTGGQTAFDLVREFSQELPHTTAAEAWQRAVYVTSDTQVNPELEPRITATVKDQLPQATHPFFWSGYLLVDTGVRPQEEGEPVGDDDLVKKNAGK